MLVLNNKYYNYYAMTTTNIECVINMRKKNIVEYTHHPIVIIVHYKAVSILSIETIFAWVISLTLLTQFFGE